MIRASLLNFWRNYDQVPREITTCQINKSFKFKKNILSEYRDFAT